MLVTLLRSARDALYKRYHPDYKWMICDVTYFMLLPGFYALWKGLYGHALWPFIVFFTSQLRWRDPIVWKDRVDRLAVACALFYNLVSAWSAPLGVVYMATSACGIGMFCLGVYLHDIGLPLESHLAHAGLHLFANVGNTILYSSLTP